MHKITLLLLATILLFYTSCKQSKEAVAGTEMKETVQTNPVKTDSLPTQSRLILTFFSIASGVDIKAMNRFEEFIGEYAVEIGKKVDYEKTHWGREGETDFCLKLTELTEEQQADFVSRTRKLMESAEHLSIYENEPCKQRRKRE